MEEFLNNVVGILWGPPLLIGLLGTGIYFSVITKFWQIRHFADSFRSCFMLKGRGEFISSDKNKISPYQAAAVAIGGCIGSGNIGGVASAVALGGPGALFWMWVTALVGMMTKMVEVTLAVYYREEDADGEKVGGPLFYIRKGVGSKYPFWGIFSVLFTMGIFLQLILAPEAYTVGEALHEVTGHRVMYLSAFFALMCGLVIWGGLSRVVHFASIMMPVMSFIYIVGGWFIIVMNIAELPGAIALIVKSAFQPMAAVGGFAGATVSKIVSTGLARSVYSNEAGWGTSPMIHATAKTPHPVEQGLWGSFEVFFDTIIICSITGVSTIISGQWTSGKNGGALAVDAFHQGFGVAGALLLAVIMIIFTVTTAGGWYTYYMILLKHVFKKSGGVLEKIIVKAYLIFRFLPGLFWTVYLVKTNNQGFVWTLVDVSSAIPTFVNMFVILMLSGDYFKLLKDYKARNFNIGTTDPDFSVFYEDKLKKEGRSV